MRDFCNNHLQRQHHGTPWILTMLRALTMPLFSPVEITAGPSTPAQVSLLFSNIAQFHLQVNTPESQLCKLDCYFCLSHNYKGFLQYCQLQVQCTPFFPPYPHFRWTAQLLGSLLDWSILIPHQTTWMWLRDKIVPGITQRRSRDGGSIPSPFLSSLFCPILQFHPSNPYMIMVSYKSTEPSTQNRHSEHDAIAGQMWQVGRQTSHTVSCIRKKFKFLCRSLQRILKVF